MLSDLSNQAPAGSSKLDNFFCVAADAQVHRHNLGKRSLIVRNTSRKNVHSKLQINAIPPGVRAAPPFHIHFSVPAPFCFSLTVAALELQTCRGVEQAKPVTQRSYCLATVTIHKFLRNLWIVLITGMTSLRRLVLEGFVSLASAIPGEFARPRA